jgi:uncharacterized membrane protein
VVYFTLGDLCWDFKVSLYTLGLHRYLEIVEVLILIALALVDALKATALKNKTFRSLWTVAERATPGLKEIDETSYRKGS